MSVLRNSMNFWAAIATALSIVSSVLSSPVEFETSRPFPDYSMKNFKPNTLPKTKHDQSTQFVTESFDDSALFSTMNKSATSYHVFSMENTSRESMLQSNQKYTETVDDFIFHLRPVDDSILDSITNNPDNITINYRHAFPLENTSREALLQSSPTDIETIVDSILHSIVNKPDTKTISNQHAFSLENTSTESLLQSFKTDVESIDALAKVSNTNKLDNKKITFPLENIFIQSLFQLPQRDIELDDDPVLILNSNKSDNKASYHNAFHVENTARESLLRSTQTIIELGDNSDFSLRKNKPNIEMKSHNNDFANSDPLYRENRFPYEQSSNNQSKMQQQQMEDIERHLEKSIAAIKQAKDNFNNSQRLRKISQNSKMPISKNKEIMSQIKKKVNFEELRGNQQNSNVSNVEQIPEDGQNVQDITEKIAIFTDNPNSRILNGELFSEKLETKLQHSNETANKRKEQFINTTVRQLPKPMNYLPNQPRNVKNMKAESDTKSSDTDNKQLPETIIAFQNQPKQVMKSPTEQIHGASVDVFHPYSLKFPKQSKETNIANSSAERMNIHLSNLNKTQPEPLTGFKNQYKDSNAMKSLAKQNIGVFSNVDNKQLPDLVTKDVNQSMNNNENMKESVISENNPQNKNFYRQSAELLEDQEIQSEQYSNSWDCDTYSEELSDKTTSINTNILNQENQTNLTSSMEYRKINGISILSIADSYSKKSENTSDESKMMVPIIHNITDSNLSKNEAPKSKPFPITYYTNLKSQFRQPELNSEKAMRDIRIEQTKTFAEKDIVLIDHDTETIENNNETEFFANFRNTTNMLMNNSSMYGSQERATDKEMPFSKKSELQNAYFADAAKAESLPSIQSHKPKNILNAYHSQELELEK